MRRAIASAVVAGAAGIVLGLAPLGSAVAAAQPQTLPQTWWCSDQWHGQDWRTCCDPSRGDDRPSWCWDWRSDNGNWNHDSSWDNSWNRDNNWNHDSGWNNDSNWNHDNWSHDNGWNHDNGGDGNWNHDGNGGHDGNWSHDSSWSRNR